MNENEGALVPFNMFYDALEKFLDHSYRGVIYKAWDNDYLNPDREKECFNVNVLKDLKVTVLRTRPVEEAIITRGGVDTKQLDPKTMQSKLVSGLFFAGEVIDVDAYTGGFNLQIAFSTGHLAGLCAAQ